MRGSPQSLDRLTYITPDGVEYMMSPPVFLLQEDGYGMPPMEFVTERGPRQHGESVKDLFLKPRTIQLVVRRNGCSRAEYWNLRAQLLDILRPLRTGRADPGILRKYLANGSVRELFAHASEGPGFPSHGNDAWDEWSIQDTLRFTCYDPIARDPALRMATYVSTGVVGVFPITFPLTIASFGSGSQTIQYDGTWESYPTIIFNGPITGPFIRNLTTGELIQFNASIPSGQTVTIDLTYGKKTVTTPDGTNYIGYISSDSDLATFHLTPGPNQIQASASGTSSISSIVLSWYNRFIGF